MTKIKLFSLVSLLALAAITLTNCGGGGVDTPPELTFSTDGSNVSEDISLAGNTSFSVGIEASHTGPLASLIITKAVDGGAQVPINGCAICDTVLTESTFSGTFNDITGGTAGTEVYSFTVSDAAGLSTTKTITITNLGTSGTALTEFTQDNSGDPFRVYNFIGPNSGAYQIGVGNLFSSEPDSQKDIQDSVSTADGTTWPARWTSRNNTQFRVASAYNWGNTNNTSELEAAWNASGASQSVVDVVDGDVYILNIAGTGKYALVEITDVASTPADNNDYVQFRYKYNP